mgnify:CR=1 FL=1
MIKTLFKRLLQIIPTLLVVVSITFIITRAIPGNPAATILGPQASTEDIAKEIYLESKGTIMIKDKDGKTVSVIDTETNTAIATVKVGSYPREVAVAPGEKKILSATKTVVPT